MEDMQSNYGVAFRDVTQLRQAQGIDLKGYQIKSFAVMFSSFEEVLWIDSDNMPLRVRAAYIWLAREHHLS